MGNGAKAQQKQQRNAKKAQDSGAKRRVNELFDKRWTELRPFAFFSQLKTNEAAKSIICQTCRQTFLSTTRLPALTQHVENKHSGKTVADCFPDYKE
ncbi:unnamed protein product [Rhizoctonia solani]|uniref:At2g23090-like zinc-binding domain-containing protein n=1 Tax=Rhizoctonia solani TaxID=456999 RepID=A0A8H3H6M0_9AGAM|nr:unnamed protein product [Rhizoctonia solani]